MNLEQRTWKSGVDSRRLLAAAIWAALHGFVQLWLLGALTRRSGGPRAAPLSPDRGALRSTASFSLVPAEASANTTARARRAATDDIMSAIAALSGQERADSYHVLSV